LERQTRSNKNFYPPASVTAWLSIIMIDIYAVPTDSNLNWTLIDDVSKHEVMEPYVTVDKACHKKRNRY